MLPDYSKLLAKSLRGVRNLKKKFKKLKTRYIYLAIALPIVLPTTSWAATAQTAAPMQNQPVVITNVEVKVSYDRTVVASPDKNLSITVVESSYAKQQKQKRLLAKQATSIVVANVSDEEKRVWVQKAAAAYNIDWKVLEAVWQVESGKSWIRSVQSGAGASGPCQFMPGTWRGYAHDGNGDGVKNINDARDCLFGAAQLLARNGAANGDHNRALLSYNHSQSYVNKVLALANNIN